MKDQDLVNTLRRAAETQDNIALKVLLLMAAERLEQKIKE